MDTYWACYKVTKDGKNLGEFSQSFTAPSDKEAKQKAQIFMSDFRHNAEQQRGVKYQYLRTTKEI